MLDYTALRSPMYLRTFEALFAMSLTDGSELPYTIKINHTVIWRPTWPAEHCGTPELLKIVTKNTGPNFGICYSWYKHRQLPKLLASQSFSGLGLPIVLQVLHFSHTSTTWCTNFFHSASWIPPLFWFWVSLSLFYRRQKLLKTRNIGVEWVGMTSRSGARN